MHSKSSMSASLLQAERSSELHSEDEDFWWLATAPSLGQLLLQSDYSDSNQTEHLSWYRKYILPALGPRPVAGKKALFEPCPVFDGSAVEHSINWKELEKSRTVRFTIEAVDYEAGTRYDPYNQKAAVGLLNRMRDDGYNVCLDKFDVFASSLFMSPDTHDELLKRLSPGTPLSQIWIAFDLLRGSVMAKAYFMPVLRWRYTGVPTKDLVFAAIRSCDQKYGGFADPVEVLDSYLCSFPPERSPVIEMVAVDCVDSPSARIKCYLRTGANTLARALDQFTLGGRLSGDAIEEGCRALEELWPILFSLPEHDAHHTPVFPSGNYCGCAVEMKPGQARPDTKLHIPVRKIAGTDAELCKTLSVWFARRGHQQFAREYKDKLTAAL